MPLKTGNTVAVERRVDLASLFCMIGRHGPAVALAVIAVVSVVAGLVIYRAVRRKRRKATAAADGDCDDGGPEGDESLIRESHGSVESTDVNDEGSSDVKEDVDLIPSDLRIRHRRAAAAEETPAPSSPPESDVRSPDIECVSSDGTEEAAVVCDSHQAGEANGSPQSDACTEAEMVSEDAVDRHRCESGDSIKDVLEEFHDSCLKEPEPINAANHEQGEEVSTAECQEDEGVTPEKDVFDETPRQEDSFQCASNDPVCFKQTSRMSENGDEAASSVESNSEEPVIHIEVSVPSVCCGKDEQFERDNTDGIGFSSYSGKARLAPEGESRNESEEAEEHPLDYLPIGEPAVISSTFQRESNLPPMQQEQRDHAKDEVAAPIRGSDRDEDGGLAGEEVVREDHFNKLTVAKLDATSAQLDEQGAEGVSGLTCDQEVGVLYDGAEQAKGKMPTCGNDVACSEERGGSSVVLSPAVTCLNTPVKADNHNVALSGTSSIADLSLDCQPPQKEDNTAPSLDEDTNSPILGPQMPSPKTENLPDNNGNGTAVVLAEEHNDQQMIRKEAFDEESVAAVPDRAANVPSVLVDDISCPPLQSICQDQQIDPVEKNETSDETRIDSATDACNTTSCTALSMSEELSPDTQSSSQDQRSDQTTNNKEDFSEVTAAPVLTEDMNTPSCQIDLPSFEHFALRDNDISAPGVGEESGISSMAVSPDAVDECDVIFDEMVLQAVDCDLKPEGQTEAQNDPFADDVSVIEEDAACMVSCPEDMFGHEIEDGYYKMIDQLVAQIADGITCVTEKQSDMKFVVESEEKKKGGCVDMKEATKAEKEKEEDYEKTEISIMEATMDHNEWIMDSNYQAFPWMNLSVTSFAQDDTKNNQFPTEECQYSSAAADTRCTDTTDIPPSAEVLQAGTLSLLDEDIQNVQPMPQNVNVTFCVHYFTQTPYQTVAVTGNQRELGNWKGFVLLERAKDGHWATAVSLPAESHVEWKFVVVDKGEVCRWEECGNRLLDTASGDELLVHKCWARL